jgi:hypothetical protein
MISIMSTVRSVARAFSHESDHLVDCQVVMLISSVLSVIFGNRCLVVNFHFAGMRPHERLLGGPGHERRTYLQIQRKIYWILKRVKVLEIGNSLVPTHRRQHGGCTTPPDGSGTSLHRRNAEPRWAEPRRMSAECGQAHVWKA